MQKHTTKTQWDETNLPTKLTVYDYGNSERIVVEFEEFVLNPNLQKEIFEIEKNE